jgi:hypothetical protein
MKKSYYMLSVCASTLRRHRSKIVNYRKHVLKGKNSLSICGSILRYEKEEVYCVFSENALRGYGNAIVNNISHFLKGTWIRLLVSIYLL